MTDATELDEAAIRTRLEAATPGPWHEEPDPDLPGWCCVTQGDYGWVAPGQGPIYDVDSDQGKADAEFIAHARTDVGLLLTALDEARAEVARVLEASACNHDAKVRWFRRAEAAEVEVERLRVALDATNARANDWMGSAAAREDALDSLRTQVERLHFDLDREARARQAAEQERNEARTQVSGSEALAAIVAANDRAEAAEGALAAVRALDRGHVGDGCRFPDDDCRCSVSLFDLRAALATPTTTEGGEDCG